VPFHKLRQDLVHGTRKPIPIDGNLPVILLSVLYALCVPRLWQRAQAVSSSN
jgi:hypothetical protein